MLPDNGTMQPRVDAARNNGTDLFMSIHMNGVSSPSASGATMHYFYEYSYQIAQAVYDRMRAVEKNYDGLGNRASPCWWSPFYVTRFTDCPSILIECGFMTNPLNLDLLVNPSYQDRLTQGHRRGRGGLFPRPFHPLRPSGDPGGRSHGPVVHRRLPQGARRVNRFISIPDKRMPVRYFFARTFPAAAAYAERRKSPSHITPDRTRKGQGVPYDQDLYRPGAQPHQPQRRRGGQRPAGTGYHLRCRCPSGQSPAGEPQFRRSPLPQFPHRATGNQQRLQSARPGSTAANSWGANTLSASTATPAPTPPPAAAKPMSIG